MKELLLHVFVALVGLGLSPPSAAVAAAANCDGYLQIESNALHESHHQCPVVRFQQ